MILHARKIRWRGLALALVLLAPWLTFAAAAQVAPSGTRPSRSLWVGEEYSNFDAGFPYQSHQRLSGYGVFADYFTTPHLGVEADARFLIFQGFHGESEFNYLAGPQYRFSSFRKFQFYGQGLAGLAKIQFPFSVGSGTYFAVVPSGGVSYRIARNCHLRAGYDYEFWLNSPNVSNEPAHRITPNGFHAGVAFSLRR